MLGPQGHQTVGRPIEDAIKRRGGGEGGLGINPTESYSSWSTKQRQSQVKGKVTWMDLKRACVRFPHEELSVWVKGQKSLALQQPQVQAAKVIEVL
ncbi:hypothetical protein QQF64_011097 [Cirrhinus molitorella]|uniref:Uncharacterized protein n=1 Tax=Cirrhinus molitorella TaxID=172907 RepID=A0ABR3M2D3_9TELE